MYHLSAQEKGRLKNGIRAAYAVPFVDDVGSFVWEAVFAYVKDVPCVDPLCGRRSKRLYDVVDPVKHIGWSAKSLQWGSVKGDLRFELVIQRADIFKKCKMLGFPILERDSATETLGRALLIHWYNKVYQDADKQGVNDLRICILVKSNDRRRYAYFEEDIEIFEPKQLEWQWTDETKTGLQGISVADGDCVFRWYPNQKQLFKSFVLPKDIYQFRLTPKRLPVVVAVETLVETLSHKET